MHLSEDRFTKATKTCPNPHLWHAVDSDSTEIEVTEFIACLIRAIKPNLVLETGSHLGQTSYAIGQSLKQNGIGRLITLEIDAEKCRLCKERCKGLPVDVVNEDSTRFNLKENVQFAWFDSLLHLREIEFLRFRPFLSNLVGFHDTAKTNVVSGAIERLKRSQYITPVYFNTPRGFCLAQLMPQSRDIKLQ